MGVRLNSQCKWVEWYPSGFAWVTLSNLNDVQVEFNWKPWTPFTAWNFMRRIFR